jgi:hypothetical protein
MEMAFFEMLFSQDCRLESPGRSILWLGWLLLCRPKSVWKVAMGGLFEASTAFKKALSQASTGLLYLPICRAADCYDFRY